MPPDVQSVCGHLQGPLLQAALRACRHDDESLVGCLHDGFEAIGTITPSGTWAPREEMDAEPLAAVLAAARQRQDHDRIKLPREHRRQLWDGIKEQVQRGRFQVVRGQDTAGLVKKLRVQLGDFVDLLYFGVDQQGKVRGCQGSRAAGVAAATRLCEQMHMMGLDGATALVRAARRAHPSSRLLLAKVDWKKMFYQAGLLPGHRRFFVSFVTDVDANEVVAVVPRCMTFGGRAQPQQCARMARAVVIVARRFLGLLCDHHMDDVTLCGTSDSAGGEFKLLCDLHNILGFEIAGPSDACDKYFEPASHGVLLGAHFNLPDPQGNRSGILLEWSLPKSKAEAYAAELLQAREHCPPGAASKLGGRFTWAFALSWGRAGGIFLRVIYDQAHGATSRTSRRFRMSIDGLLDMLQDPGPGGLRRAIFCPPCNRPHCVLIGDARGRGEPYGTEALGAILADARLDQWEFFSLPVCRDLENVLPPGREQRINEAETLWVWIALRTWGRQLQGADVTIVVDSSAAEGVIRKGMSGSTTLCCLSAEVWRAARLLGARIWVVRIASAANPADPLSRLEVGAALACGWRPVDQPDLPAAWHFDPQLWGTCVRARRPAQIGT